MKLRVKYIEQPDEKDCGPTSLAMISRYYGKKVSISRLREYCETDIHGTNILGLIHGGSKIGLTIEGYELENISEMKNLNFPFIAHIINEKGFEHYVVVNKLTKHHIYLLDPAKGKIKMYKENFIEQWTNVILSVEKNYNFNKENESPSTLNFFKEILVKNKSYIGFILFSSIVVNIITIIGAFYFKALVDKIIPSTFLNNLHNLSIGILILYFVFFICSFFRYQLVLHMGLKINKNIMLDYYNHILNLPSKFFETRKDGEILSRFRDTDHIREAFSSVTVTLIMDILMIIIGVFLLYSQSPTLFLIVLIITPTYLLTIGAFKQSFEKYSREEMERNAELSSKFIEGIHGIDTIKSFNAESFYFQKIKYYFYGFINKVYKLGFFNNIQTSIKDFMHLLTTLIILWVGSTKVINGEITLGELLTFNALVVYFFGPIERLVESQYTLQSAIVATRRVIEILDLKKEEKLDDYSSENCLINDVRFLDVSFQYGYRKNILSKVSFSVEKNQTLALIGESGSGKSTIAKLLLKYYEPTEGSILINGMDNKKIDTSTMRKEIGYVSQSNYLFNGTIRDNLIINGTSDIDQIINACKIAEIHEFIQNLPQGYDTMIENNGSNFSGGQLQRLAIARAILKNPQILILDEPTSSLDLSTSNAIKRNLKTLQCIIIIITHDLSMAKNCDQIVLLSSGRILEKGTHTELLNQSNYYFDLMNYK